MSSAPPPVTVDLADFDAIGAMSAVVLAVRSHAIESGVDATATVSAPDGWHEVVVGARGSGHVVLGVRYTELSTSRRHNVSRALAQRQWQLDEDHDGVTFRFPPGTDPTTAAFEVLAALTSSGAPNAPRQVTAVDAHGTPIPLA